MSGVYDKLPRAYLDEDAKRGFPLRKYLSLVGDQLDEVAGVVSRIGPETGKSALADPDHADAGWLAWMAQLTGASLSGLTTVAQRRAAIQGSGSGWLAGTMQGIANAVRATLTDPAFGYVAVYRDPVNPWKLNIVTKAIQTPDPAAALAAVSKAGAKPVGVVLDWSAYRATWGVIEPLTWDGIESLGSWDALEAYS